MAHARGRFRSSGDDESDADARALHDRKRKATRSWGDEIDDAVHDATAPVPARKGDHRRSVDSAHFSDASKTRKIAHAKLNAKLICFPISRVGARIAESGLFCSALPLGFLFGTFVRSRPTTS